MKTKVFLPAGLHDVLQRSITMRQSVIRRVAAAFLKRWGTPAAKQRVWDSEYRSGHWTYIREDAKNKSRDPIYGFLERYGAAGTILDLGCGGSMTALEMKPGFREYVGVDISEEAVVKARASLNGQGELSDRFRFYAGDIISFIPGEKFSVILFRESLYYIPFHRIRSMLLRYSNFLASDGVYLIRLCDRRRYRNIITLLERNFTVRERYEPDDSTAAIMACSAPRNVLAETGNQKQKPS